MAITIEYEVGAACGGGNHFPVTATRVEQPAQTLTVLLTKEQATAPLTAQERAVFTEMLIRFLCAQGNGLTNAQIKTNLEATVTDLTLANT